LPALSDAVTVRVLVPAEREMLDTDHDVVPVAVPLAPVVEFAQVTFETSTASLAVPERAIVLVVVAYVVAVVGEEMAITGAVVSGTV